MGESVPNQNAAPIVIGKFALFDQLASGGMATVHLGRVLGNPGRTVAIKRLHDHMLKDDEFVTMFMDEARIVSRIPKHPNVVPMVDLIRTDEGIFLVMDYVHGESLSRLLRETRRIGEPVPSKIVGAIASGILHGLHAAHETRGRDGALLNIVHRDVSPHNIMVGADGVTRVLDFGIAKAAGRAQATREGQLKGKIAYMAPEQIRGQVDRRTDVFAAGVVLWEMLAGRRIHGDMKDVDIVSRLVRGKLDPPSMHAPNITPDIDALVLKGAALDVSKRYANARDLALDIEKRIGVASPQEVGAWAEKLARDVLVARAERVEEIEEASRHLVPDEFIVIEERVRRPYASMPESPAADAVAPTSRPQAGLDELDDVDIIPDDPSPPTTHVGLGEERDASSGIARRSNLAAALADDVVTAPPPVAPSSNRMLPPPIAAQRAAFFPKIPGRFRDHPYFVPAVLVAFVVVAALAFILGGISIHDQSAEDRARVLGAPSGPAAPPPSAEPIHR